MYIALLIASTMLPLGTPIVLDHRTGPILVLHLPSMLPTWPPAVPFASVTQHTVPPFGAVTTPVPYVVPPNSSTFAAMPPGGPVTASVSSTVTAAFVIPPGGPVPSTAPPGAHAFSAANLASYPCTNHLC